VTRLVKGSCIPYSSDAGVFATSSAGALYEKVDAVELSEVVELSDAKAAANSIAAVKKRAAIATERNDRLGLRIQKSDKVPYLPLVTVYSMVRGMMMMMLRNEQV
jgi:hypothetical protein